jgi:hypothetical protein
MANRLILALAAVSLLGACSIWATPEEQDAYRAAHPESVRHAARADVRQTQASTPARAANPTPSPAPAPAAIATPPSADNTIVASNAVAPPPPAPARDTNNGEIVVPGQLHRQITPPPGDPRSVMERMADIRSWDRCVMHAQNQSSDPTRPMLESPEDICRQSLGMENRTAVPDSRKPHN